jgi:hypothetical protein
MVSALGVFAAPANARIVPFVSIAGFAPGVPESEVRAKLGEPSSVRVDAVGMHTLVYSRRKLEFLVMDADQLVSAVGTRSRAHKTPDRVGVGTRLKTLRSKLRGERCSVLRRHTNCAVYGRGAIMDFIVRRGVVAEVWLAKGSPPPR